MVRLFFVPLSALAIVTWSLLYPEAKPPLLPWIFVVELLSERPRRPGQAGIVVSGSGHATLVADSRYA